jgi:hypothetical protein
MSNALSWSFGLSDGLSGPAGKMANALDKVEGGLSQLDGPLRGIEQKIHAVGMGMDAAAEASRGLQRAQLSVLQNMNRNMFQFRSEVTKLVEGLGKVQKATGAVVHEEKEAGTVGGGLFGGLLAEMYPVLGTLQQVLGAIRQVGGALIDGGVSLAKFGFAQASFKASTLQSLQVILGSREAATGFFDVLNKISDITPFDMKDVLPAGRTLLSTGLSQKAAENVMLGISDLVTRGGGKSADFGQAMSEVQRIIGADKIDQRELEVLSRVTGGGINNKTMAEAIANGRKISLDAARGLLRHGIGGQEAVKYMLDLAAKSGGGVLGTVSRELGEKMFEGQISNLQNNFERLFQDIKLGPVTEFLAKLNTLLDANSESGKRLRQVFNGLFDKVIGGFLERYSGEAGAKRMMADIEGIIDKIGRLAEAAINLSRVLSGIGGTAMSAAFGAGPNASGKEVTNAFLVRRETEALFADQGPDSAQDFMQGAAVARALGRFLGMVPQHAAGGIVTGPQLGMIGEAGPEAIIPLRSLRAEQMLGGGGRAVSVSIGDVHVTASGASAREVADELRERLNEMVLSAIGSAFEQLGMEAGAA